MGEQQHDLNTSDPTFDNLTILKELSNIANLIRNEDFLETVPKSKLKRMKWVPMFNCLKQNILGEMVEDISSMWEYENMPLKLNILEKQKEKFAEINPENIPVWRPHNTDVASQINAADVANLKKQKVLLESFAKEYEMRVIKLKKTLAAKRGYLKVLQMDMQKYQKKNEEVLSHLSAKIENCNTLPNITISDDEIQNSVWTEKDLIQKDIL